MIFTRQIEHLTLKSPWRLFVIISIVVHTILLASWDYKSKPQPGSDRSSNIAVTLIVTSEGNNQSTKPLTRQTIKKGQHSPGKDRQLTKVKQSVRETFSIPEDTKVRHSVPEQAGSETKEITVSSEKAVTATNRLKTEDLSRKLIEQRLLSEIRVEFARHFNYPARALRKNIQGEVILSFRLDANGIISNVSIEHSSGYGILDRAAVESLNKITPLNDVSGSSFAFTLPVIYKIKEG